MKYAFIALLFVACTSKVDSLKKEYYEKTALRDSLRIQFFKIQDKLRETHYSDTSIIHQGNRLGIRVDNLSDSIARLKEQISIEK